MVNGDVGVTKIKIKAYNPAELHPAQKPNNGGKAPQAPVPEPTLKAKDTFINRFIRIMVNDVHKKIHGEPVKKMPESKENWEDWRDQL